MALEGKKCHNRHRRARNKGANELELSVRGVGEDVNEATLVGASALDRLLQALLLELKGSWDYQGNHMNEDAKGGRRAKRYQGGGGGGCGTSRWSRS